MHTRKIWRFQNSNEYEYSFKGRYGAKGEKRAERTRPTPEQIKKQNQRNKEKYVRRLIKANFTENDYWNTLKYPAGTRIKMHEVKKHKSRFFKKLRKMYKKAGCELKYIYRIEVSRRGTPHIHVLINRIPEADLMMKKAWEHGGINFELTYEAGGFKNLAEYIVKQPDQETDPTGETVAYNSSRNLIRPQPEKKDFYRRTVEKIIREGPKPTKGYYIVADSVIYGVNKFTGMSYLYYEEELLRKKTRKRE